MLGQLSALVSLNPLKRAWEFQLEALSNTKGALQ